MAKEPEEMGFRVSDKRMFTEEGDVRKDAPAGESPKSVRAEDAKVADEARQAGGMAIDDDARIDFPSYVLSYYTQGLVLLGEVPNPLTNAREQDLQGARHTVDILTMLEEKTKGNLSKEEEQLLSSVLYELRMKFMAKTNRIKL